MDKSKDKSKTIQWHQGFYSGLEPELREYKDILTFETEHQLNREPLRIVITLKLGEEYTSLRMLTTDIRQEDIMRFLTQSDQLTEKDDREHIDDVLTVSTAVNQKTYERVKEDQTMVGPAVLELMKDELEEVRAAGIEQGIEQGIVENE